jgi:hypothetical protein
MNYPYNDLNSWSTHYREDALQAAQRRHLEHLAKAHRRQRSEEQVRSPLLSKLAAVVGLS